MSGPLKISQVIYQIETPVSMRRGERQTEKDIIKVCSLKHGSPHLPSRSASHAAKGSSGGGGIVVLLSNRVKQINGCFHSGTKVKDPVRSTNTHM